MAQELQAVAEPLIHLDLQGIIAAGGLIRVIAQVLCPHKGSAVGHAKCLGAAVEIWTAVALRIGQAS